MEISRDCSHIMSHESVGKDASQSLGPSYSAKSWTKLLGCTWPSLKHRPAANENNWESLFVPCFRFGVSPACHANGRSTVRSQGWRSRPSGRRPRSAPSHSTSSFFNRQFDNARDWFSSIPSIELASNNLRSLHPERKCEPERWHKLQSQSRWAPRQESSLRHAK